MKRRKCGILRNLNSTSVIQSEQIVWVGFNKILYG